MVLVLPADKKQRGPTGKLTCSVPGKRSGAVCSSPGRIARTRPSQYRNGSTDAGRGADTEPLYFLFRREADEQYAMPRDWGGEGLIDSAQILLPPQIADALAAMESERFP